MDKETLLKLITSPIDSDYFPEGFLKESEAFKKLEFVSPITTKGESLFRYRQVVPEEWHSWVEEYLNLTTRGKFPWLWPFLQDGLGFEFHRHLDNFEDAEEFYSLGNDPSGDWVVMTKRTQSKILLCDHMDFSVYDGWINLNHLLAWALRLALADENRLTKEEILQYWEKQDQKVERQTIERIIDDLD